MADLTLYFPSSGASDITPAYGAIWQDTSVMTRIAMPSSKATTAIAGRSPFKNAGNPYYGGAAQWITAARAARNWTASDTFDFVMQFRDVNTWSVTTYLLIRVVSNDGLTFRGTLYAGVINATVWAGTYTSRHNDAVAVQNSVAQQTNDRIVVEVGARWATDSINSSAQTIIGEGGAGASALPLNDTDTDTDKYPWIAFTYGAAAAANVVMNII
jgi:hypothetical protein